jgi:negative regulator of flagellin synthesis FlgM
MSYSNGIGDWKTLNPVAPAATENRQTQKPAASEPAAQADQAKLSSASELMTQALGTSDVRSSKVEELKQAIASGSYNVPSSDVADKMIQSLLD